MEAVRLGASDDADCQKEAQVARQSSPRYVLFTDGFAAATGSRGSGPFRAVSLLQAQ